MERNSCEPRKEVQNLKNKNYDLVKYHAECPSTVKALMEKIISLEKKNRDLGEKWFRASRLNSTRDKSASKSMLVMYRQNAKSFHENQSENFSNSFSSNSTITH